MADLYLPTEWSKYIKYTDIILRNKELNEYSFSNPFLHPTKPSYQKLKTLKDLKNSGYISRYIIQIKFYFYLTKTLLDIFKQLFISQEFILKRTHKTKNENYDLVFVSHLNNIERLNTEFDEYYGNLINDLSKNKKILLILIPKCKLNKRKIKQFLEKNRKYNVYIFNNKLVSCNEKISCILNVLKERKKFIELSLKNKGFKKTLLHFIGNSFLSSGNYFDLVNAIQIKNILKSSKINNLITTYEGHAWERLFYYFAKKSSNTTMCIGYQHTLIFEKSASLKREFKNSYNPDYVLASGKLQFQILKKNFSNNVKVKLLGNTKYYKKNNYAKKLNIIENILFLPSGEEEEAKLMTSFALDFAKNNKSKKIIIRYHPVIKDKFKNILNTSNFRVSNKKIETDCKISRWAIYSNSTAIFEAISYGCIPINLINRKLININNPLWQIESNLVKKIKTKKELLNIVRKTRLNSTNEKKLNHQYKLLANQMKDLISPLYTPIFTNLNK